MGGRFRGPFRRLTALILLCFLILPGVWGQSDSEGDSDGSEPIPYTPEEFPGWARDLRRGEIVALGSFPVALILTNLSYRLGRFTIESLERGEFATEYAPAFVSPEQRAGLSEDQRLTMILTAGGVSVTVALVDYLLGRIERRNGNESR